MEALVQIDGYDPVAGGAVSLFLSSVDDSSVCHLNGKTWWPAIAQLPRLRYDLFDGVYSGQVDTPGSSLRFSAEPWPLLGRYTLADARIRIWTGEVATPWAAWSLRFDGRVTAQPSLADGLAELPFAVDHRWLDAPLLATYAGTTGIEGPAALKGTPKPLALGAPRYVPGVLIDPTNLVFQLSAYGTMREVEAALERLLRFGASAGNHATYAALIAAAVPAGRWATSLASGLVRFGAPLTGKQSFLVKGDEAGTDGWARKPGQLIRRVASLVGGAGKIDDASLNALDVARPYNLSVYQGEQITARELIQRIAASVNAVAGVSWLGKLFVAPIGIGAPVVTLAADGSALPPVASVGQVATAAPWWRLSVQAERCWAVHELSDVAFTAQLLDLGDYVAGTTYREGNLVQNQGSSWIYINPVPTGGNAPPVLPVEANAFWKVVAREGAAGADGTDGLNGLDGVDGIDGIDGKLVEFVWRRAATQPATPAGNGIPAGWFDDPPAGVNPLWLSKAKQELDGSLVTGVSWSTPIRHDGPPGLDGSDGTDGTNGFNGEDGVDGIDGNDGKLVEFVWRRAAAQPAAPAGNGIPAGWFDDPPAGTDPLWLSKAKQELDGSLVAGAGWSTPIRHDGPPGLDGTDGTDGSNGTDGQSVTTIYIRASAAPATPAASAATPAGWYAKVDDVPAGVGTIWMSVGKRAGGVANFTWEVPLRQEGVSGTSAGYPAKSISGPTTTTPAYGVEITLEDGQSITCAGSILTVSNSNGGSVTAQVQASVVGSVTWSAFTMADNVITFAAFDPGIGDFTGVFTNNSGSRKVYSIRCQVTSTAAVSIDGASSFYKLGS